MEEDAIFGELANLIFQLEDFHRHMEQSAKFTWVTKEGKKIKVCNLNTSHIRNIIGLLSRKPESPKLNSLIGFFKYELKVRDEYESLKHKLEEYSRVIDIVF